METAIATVSTITKYKEGSDEQKEFLSKIESLQKVLGKEPPEKFILNHQGKFDYIPISYVEHNLDKYFFGHWSTYDFKYQQIVNEIIADITLSIINPVTGERITRVGAAGVAIMQSKGATLMEFTDTKIKTALVTGFPRLKAECIKNAAKSFGKKLGRDLNREHTDSYSPIIGVAPQDELETLRDNIMSELVNYKGEDREEIKAMCVEKNKAGEFTIAFAINICERLGLPVKV